MNNTSNYILIPPSQIVASGTNPRTHFDEGALDELAAGIRAQGVETLTPLLVRPLAGGKYEIVFGERRWRAAMRGGLPLLPCVVRELGDEQAEEMQFVENLQREDLTPMEEARGFARMLSKCDAGGKPRHTPQRLAERLGCRVEAVRDALALLKLPAVAVEAVETGAMAPAVARQLARVPDTAARARAAAEAVEARMTRAELRAHLGKNYMVGLKTAVFDVEDAGLVPAAGACGACPKMTDNCAALFDEDERVGGFLKRKMCCDPECFRAKTKAHSERVAAAARDAGKVVMGEAEARKIFPAHLPAGEAVMDSPLVPVAAVPEAWRLKKEVEGVTETWGDLVARAEEKTGGRVPTVLVPDQAGVLVECVEVRVAMAAVEQGGETIFAVEGGGGKSRAESREARGESRPAKLSKKEKAVAEANRRETRAALKAAGKRLAVLEVVDPACARLVLRAAFESPAVESRMPAAAKMLGLNAATAQQARSLSVVDMLRLAAMAIAIFHADNAIGAGTAAHEDLVELAHSTGSGPSGGARKGSEVRGQRTEVGGRKAVVTMDAKTLAEWVKADAAGMPRAEIARSWKVPLAEVEGALQGAKPKRKAKRAWKVAKKKGRK